MTHSRGRSRAGLWALAALALAPSPALCGPSVPFEQDSHAFRFILQQAGLKPLTQLEEIGDAPARTLLIVFGDTTSLDLVPGGVKGFVESGGAVFIATDRPPFFGRGRWRGGPREPTSWEQQLGIQVSGSPVRAMQPASAYRGDLACPFLTPLKEPNMPALPPGLRVATNRPSYLWFGEDSRLRPFLNFPPDCVIATRRGEGNFPLIPLGVVTQFGAGGRLGAGKALVLADHSVFINGMMLQTDNGNFDFAYNCVRWLAGPDHPCDRCLFLDEGSAVASFEVPLTMVPDVTPSAAEVVNRVIARVEEDDLLNGLILRHVTPRRLLAGLAGVLTVLLLVYAFYRLARAGYQPEAHVPRAARRAARLVPALAVIDQRRQALLAQDNLWEAARALARGLFAGLGVEVPAAPDGVRPRVTVRAGWRGRRAWRAAVAGLWQLAASPRPRRVSRRRFARLVNQVEEVKNAVREGTLHVAGPGESA